MQRRPEPRAGPYGRPRGQLLAANIVAEHGELRAGCMSAQLLTATLKKASSVATLLRLVGEHGDAFNHIHCCAVWSYLGKQAAECREPRHQPGLGRLLRLTEARVSTCTARSLATVAHGVAKSRVAGAREVLATVAAAAVPRLREFDPQALTNMAWAYATVGHAAPALLDAIAAAAVTRMSDFYPQTLSNIVWAYAKVRHSAPALLDAIAVAAAPRLREFNAQDLTNTAWAYAKAGHSAPALLDAIAVAAVPRLCDFKPQEIANTAWAYATLAHEAPALLDAIAEDGRKRMGDFNAQDRDSLVRAYATAGHEAPAWLEVITEIVS